MSKIIINFTPTGMIPMKKDTPYVPVSVEEIVQDVKEAYALGISMVHLHARDEQGLPSSDKEVYAQIIQGSELSRRIWSSVCRPQAVSIMTMRPVLKSCLWKEI